MRIWALLSTVFVCSCVIPPNGGRVNVRQDILSVEKFPVLVIARLPPLAHTAPQGEKKNGECERVSYA